MSDARAAACLLETVVRSAYLRNEANAMHPGQWAVLRFIGRADPDDCTIGGVASHLGVVHSTASRAVAALARKQLVDICPRREGRQLHIQLTREGQRTLAYDPFYRLCASIATLPVETRKALAASLEEIESYLNTTAR